MAHAGGVKPSIEMQVVDGKLIEGKSGQRMGVIGDVDEAVAQLLQGKIVFVQQYGSTVADVRSAVEQALQGKS